MTTLQESAMHLALAALTSTDALPYEDWMRASGHPAIKALNAALAQQREQQPVCHGCGIPAGDVHMSTCKSGKWPSRVSNGDTAAPAPVEQRCTYCDGTGDVHSIDGEWRGTCPCAAAPAPQPAQEPVKFLVNGTRFKLSFDTRGRVSSLWNFMDELDGRWVALVAAEDDCHLQSTALPVTAAGEREAGFTTGHCKEHAKPGGCQLHNLQCGYPACDRRAV